MFGTQGGTPNKLFFFTQDIHMIEAKWSEYLLMVISITLGLHYRWQKIFVITEVRQKQLGKILYDFSPAPTDNLSDATMLILNENK